ncbi:casein kinase II subunit beta [Gregarina niphandrodes]|uniref:Casein kinase II subunit beta n=1 Tax=Gregarina niphandrodes TaxID=110365 RepID=A0A023B4A0_GRENI|nr:casein kinase II subunit beta [Gregarina niphandrodes]EZG56106.1 casein kinase II subunit beta [Gregarina niphandrodes]|eukprot:XP_011131339.1 casein kinase II subunit beta [Gregarina niphandrodes]
MSASTPWILWFCSLKGNQIFAPVEAEFIRDAFNLFGLKPKFKDYAVATRVILGDEIPPHDLSSLTEESRLALNEAVELYGLIHARYILTQTGLTIMAQKYKEGVFGVCPRILCQKQAVLPIGISEELRQHRCRVYCPNCQEVYIPRGELIGASDIDGAFFGTTFPHMLLMADPRLVSPTVPIPHIPQLFGFKQYGVKSVVLQKVDNGEYGVCAREQMGSQNDARYVK